MARGAYDDDETRRTQAGGHVVVWERRLLEGHVLVAFNFTPESVAHCSCGWRSIPAWSLRHAEARWCIHAAERRAAGSFSAAVDVRLALQRRKAELAKVRESATARRVRLHQQMSSLHAANIPSSGQQLETSAGSAASLLERGRDMAGLSVDALWCDYMGLGGDASAAELGEMLRGKRPLARLDHDLVAQALNERFADDGMGYPLDYWNEQCPADAPNNPESP
jgi:hypothetical protein